MKDKNNEEKGQGRAKKGKSKRTMKRRGRDQVPASRRCPATDSSLKSETQPFTSGEIRHKARRRVRLDSGALTTAGSLSL